MSKIKNRLGNVLINSLLALTVTSIAILGINRTMNQSNSMQQQMMDRDLLESFVDEVVEDYIPLVHDRFISSGYYIDFHGEEQAGFTQLLDEEMESIDFSSYLNCAAQYDGMNGPQVYDYSVICTPPGSALKYTIEFDIHLDYRETGTFYYTFDHEYYSESISD